jgi:hypothetical protein
MVRTSRVALVWALAFAVLASALFTLPGARAVDITDRLVEARGSTDMLGGGDYVLIRFGADAAFGVLWGNASNPNHVYILAIKARYLGVAQVYDQGGREVTRNYPIKIYTLYALRLDGLVEFRDADGDGMAAYRRGYDGQNFTWYSETEEVSKRADLRTSWTPGTVTRGSAPGERSWDFNLTASDLPYVGVNNTVVSRGDNLLNEIEFTFHLRASLEEVDNATVPNWRITVDTSRARPVVMDFERLEDLTFRGKVARYSAKWDQRISGWDFDAGPDRRLLLEFAAVVGNVIPLGTAGWADAAYLARANETGRARYDTPTGNESANETSDLSAPRLLRSPYLDFGGNWTRIARFAWVTSDGSSQPLYGQVFAGRRILARGEAGSLFAGFILLGGLSYAPAADIVHDPDVALDVLAELDLGAGAGLVILVAAVVLGIVAVGLVGFLIRSRRRRTRPPGFP